MEDNYKHMIEDKNIYIDNDKYDLWLKKYFPNKWKEKQDKINKAFNNSLYKIMLSKNGLLDESRRVINSDRRTN